MTNQNAKLLGELSHKKRRKKLGEKKYKEDQSRRAKSARKKLLKEVGFKK